MEENPKIIKAIQAYKKTDSFNTKETTDNFFEMAEKRRQEIKNSKTSKFNKLILLMQLRLLIKQHLKEVENESVELEYQKQYDKNKKLFDFLVDKKKNDN